MKVYKLRLIIIIIVVTLFLSFPAWGISKNKLSLVKAVNLALKQDFDLKIAQTDLNNKQITYQQTKVNNILTQSKTKKLQNKLILNQAQSDYHQRKNEIIKEVINQYLKLRERKINIQVKKNRLKLRKNELNNIKAQVEQGNAKQIELIEKKIEYNSAEYDLKQVNDKYNLLLQQLKFNLGLTKDQKIVLTIINQPSIWKIKSNKSVKISKKNSLALSLKKKQVKLAKIRLKRNQVSEVSKLSIEKLKGKQRLAKLEYQKGVRQLIVSVKKNYQKLKQAEASLKLRQQQLGQLKEKYKLMKEYQEQGLKSKNQLLNTKINYLQAKYNYQQTITNYYLAALNLQQQMGMQIEVNFNELAFGE